MKRFFALDEKNNVKWYLSEFNEEILKSESEAGIKFYCEDNNMQSVETTVSEILEEVNKKPASNRKSIRVVTPEKLEEQLKPIHEMLSLIGTVITKLGPLTKALDIDDTIKAITEKRKELNGAQSDT